jgi:methylglutaconyl-CoA hydratase
VTDEAILSRVDARGVATVTLNRPGVHNAFDDALIDALTQCLQRLNSDDAVRVVVLAAEGKSFSAGADLRWMRRVADYSQEQNLEDARRLAELMKTLSRLERPTIARVQGAAFGGGVGLIACCDIAVAADSAAFSLSEVKLGLIPAVVSPYVVRAMGERHARRHMITGERFDADEARRVGLVHEVVSAEALDARVESFIEQLLLNGPAAMAAAKSLLARVASGPVDETLIEDTARRIAECRAADEAREGIAAFLEKRRPRWSRDT